MQQKIVCSFVRFARKKMGKSSIKRADEKMFLKHNPKKISESSVFNLIDGRLASRNAGQDEQPKEMAQVPCCSA